MPRGPRTALSRARTLTGADAQTSHEPTQARPGAEASQTSRLHAYRGDARAKNRPARLQSPEVEPWIHRDSLAASALGSFARSPLADPRASSVVEAFPEGACRGVRSERSETLAVPRGGVNCLRIQVLAFPRRAPRLANPCESGWVPQESACSKDHGGAGH